MAALRVNDHESVHRLCAATKALVKAEPGAVPAPELKHKPRREDITTNPFAPAPATTEDHDLSHLDSVQRNAVMK